MYTKIRAKTPKLKDMEFQVLEIARRQLNVTADKLKRELTGAAALAKKTIRALMHGPCRDPRKGMSRTTHRGPRIEAYPGFCSGSLSESFRYRVTVKASKSLAQVSIKHYRDFVPFETKRGANYGDILNTGYTNKAFKGFKQRIYERLDKALSDVVERTMNGRF